LSWLLGLIRGLGGFQKLIAQLFKSAKHLTANVRQAKKDSQVDDAISAVRNPAHRLRKRKPK
jgi:hypothetical protein